MRLPALACRTITLARAAWVSGWPSSPKPPSTNTGPTCSVGSAPSTWSSSAIDSGRPRSVRTSCSWSGTSVMTISASRSSSTARTVSRPGSPGPLPTKETHFTGRAAPAPVVAGVLDVFCLVTFAFLLLRCFVDQFCCALGQHLRGELLAEPDRIVERTGRGSSYEECAVGRERDRTDPQFVTEVPFRNFSQCADRSGAPCFELGEQRSLRLDTGAGARIVERLVDYVTQAVADAALDSEGSLAGGRQHLQRVEHLGRLVDAAETGQSGAGQDDRVESAVDDLAEAGVDVAAHVDQVDPEPERGDLGHPAGGSGADAGSLRELAEGEAVAGDDDVAGVLAGRHGGQCDAFGRRRG